MALTIQQAQRDIILVKGRSQKCEFIILAQLIATYVYSIAIHTPCFLWSDSSGVFFGGVDLHVWLVFAETVTIILYLSYKNLFCLGSQERLSVAHGLQSIAIATVQRFLQFYTSKWGDHQITETP